MKLRECWGRRGKRERRGKWYGRVMGCERNREEVARGGWEVALNGKGRRMEGQEER